MKKLFLVALLGASLACKTTAPAGSVLKDVSATDAPVVVAYNFDWDDNIFYMPTEIMVWHKAMQKEFGLSTGEWALVRQKVGKDVPTTPDDAALILKKTGQPGVWQDFEVRADALRNFGDSVPGKNQFLDDVQRGMQGQGWKGPSWDAFVAANSQPETAARTTIITARLHSPETIHQALEHLRRLGMLKFVPPAKNIYPVAYPGIDPRYAATASSPSQAKAVVMADLLDDLQRQPASADGPHTWGFSDDDWGNFSAAVAAIQKAIAENPTRWDRIKITVYFTGVNNPEHQPQALEVN